MKCPVCSAWMRNRRDLDRHTGIAHQKKGRNKWDCSIHQLYQSTLTKNTK